MFNKILLPLDGSKPAEIVLDYGMELARKMGSELVLFHTCGASHKQQRVAHKSYLEQQASRVHEILEKNLLASSSNVTSAHRSGEFLPILCEFTNTESIDLVVMVAHGATSLNTPSIVDDVVRLIKCPVLLVRSNSEKHDGDLIKRLLVPLDGTPYSQQILAVARTTAEKLTAEIVLFSAANSSGQSTSDIENQKQGLALYLNGVAALLKGLKVTTMVAEASDFAVAIDKAALQSKADMVMTITNSPVTEWAENSLTRKLLNKGATSLLVKHRG